jgi:hypothetical protein
MPVVIPLRVDFPEYDLQVVLDDVTYSLSFRWNGREEAWYMDVRTELEVDIWNGIKIVVGPKLGKRCVDVRFPPGALVAVDTTGSDVGPGLEDLGGRVQLLYYNEVELAEAVAEALAAEG